MVSLAQKAYLDVREFILGLRESVSTKGGLEGTLSEYLRKVGQQAGVATHLEIEEEHLPVSSPEVEVQIVRVIQEALTNVRRHARAKRCWIRLGQCDGSLRIAVEDDGRGFEPAHLDPENHQHLGLRIMRQRVERLGGRLEIDSAPGRGTRLLVYLPPNGS